MQETWVPSLGQEDLLEKKMAIYSSILAWEIPWTEKPGGLLSMSCKKYNTHTHTHTHTHNPFTVQRLLFLRVLVYVQGNLGHNCTGGNLNCTNV